MYLLELDNNGLVKDDVINDGWKSIKEFRELVKKHKIQGLTTVALFADYSSPLNYYNENDRFIKAVETVYEVRTKLKKDDLVLAAIKKYDMLQFNADLEHDRILRDYRGRLIERIKLAMQDESPTGEKEVERLNKTLRDHENSNKEFYKAFNRQEIIKTTAVTSSGYVLSRIENDLLNKKNSKFANEGKDLINPNKLGLQ